jgi:hypothetical protein
MADSRTVRIASYWQRWLGKRQSSANGSNVKILAGNNENGDDPVKKCAERR